MEKQHCRHACSLGYSRIGASSYSIFHTCMQDEGNVGDENKKDLRSRGLCLVPVSCTSHLAGDDSGASDFWAVAAAPPPPPLGDIIWR
ncbi:unnamed protein product [Urochloa humidicola]